MNTTLSKSDRKEIERKRKALEQSMEDEIDSLLSTRRTARQRLGDEPVGIQTCGQGRRTANARMSYRKQTVWGRPAKARFGALD